MEAFQIIRATMKEFSELPDEEVQVYISLAEPLVSKKKFGKLYEQAVAYVAAHKMKMNGMGTALAGGIQIGDMAGYSSISISEGEASLSFASSQGNSSGSISADVEYGLTTYGKQFLQLRKNCIIPIVSAGGNYGN